MATRTVEIRNTYADGHESITVETVPGPLPGQSEEDWAEEAVFPLTGDGHDGPAVYVATVRETGTRHEWIG